MKQKKRYWGKGGYVTIDDLGICAMRKAAVFRREHVNKMNKVKKKEKSEQEQKLY